MKGCRNVLNVAQRVCVWGEPDGTFSEGSRLASLSPGEQGLVRESGSGYAGRAWPKLGVRVEGVEGRI